MGGTQKKRKYRKTECYMWSDNRFLSMSDDARQIWLYLLGSHRTSDAPGLVVTSVLTMADDLKWYERDGIKSLERIENAIQEIRRRKWLEVDSEAKVMLVTNSVKHNLPSSPNVVTHWHRSFMEVPDTPLKSSWLRYARKALVEELGEDCGRVAKFDEVLYGPHFKESEIAQETLPQIDRGNVEGNVGTNVGGNVGTNVGGNLDLNLGANIAETKNSNNSKISNKISNKDSNKNNTREEGPAKASPSATKERLSKLNKKQRAAYDALKGQKFTYARSEEPVTLGEIDIDIIALGEILGGSAYPGIDPVIEIGRAANWTLTNKSKAKVMLDRFLVNWFNRRQEGGGTRGYVADDDDAGESVYDLKKKVQDAK